MITLDDSYIKATGYTEAELKLEIAVMLFAKAKLSLRKAASLAGLHWLDFMKELDKREMHCIMMKQFSKPDYDSNCGYISHYSITAHKAITPA